MLARFAAAVLALCALGLAPARAADAPDPAADLKSFQAYFRQQFPNVKFDDFVNGPYAVDQGMRKQWEEIMQFPPYDFALDEGKALFATPFKNGKTYADCFPNKGIGIKQNYPYFDEKTGEVVDLELAINRCREANGEAPLDYEKGPMTSIVAYMAETSRGKRFDIKIPNDPRALAAYQEGKEYFYTRRGQLNFSCASCHIQAAGKRLRGDILAPALGIMASFPIYRSDWGSMGTILRRFTTCNTQVRAVALKPDDKIYRNLEYFLTYLGNGLPVAGPGTRP
jgi:L-cysteine S-thiosulfotransferase